MFYRLLLASLIINADGFTFQQQSLLSSRHTATATATLVLRNAADNDNNDMMDMAAQIGYFVSVEKPLGVIFGENEDPYNGLVIDDVEPGLNGGAAGLRVGDQLLSVNGKPVIGSDFDSVMNLLVSAEGSMELGLYRGTVRMLYTIVENKKGQSVGAEEEDNDTEELDDVVMDEDYESPVQVNLADYEEKPLTPGDVVNAFKNLGAMLTADVSDKEAPPKPKQEKKGGFMGGLFSQETIQLDGDDASSKA